VKIDPNILAGFDMVCEEDRFEKITHYLEDLIIAEKDHKKHLPFVLHAGESIERGNDNLYDAILLGTKRIGHGFNLALHPHLMTIVKKEKICVECCPISNLLLGYVKDLRCHPVRTMLHHGIAVSINPDDPGFFSYDGITMDYVYAFLAWELNLADLKKLCLNSLEYSLIT